MRFGAYETSHLYISERYSFWDYVDGSPAWTGLRGPDWAEQRRSDMCMAMTSEGRRCSLLPREGVPFCSRHIQKALDWFLSFAGSHHLRTYEDAHKRLIEQRHAYEATAQALEAAAEDGRISQVYFYYLPHADLVKIGTSINLKVRIADFAKGRGCAWPEGVSPEGGRLLGSILGGRALESSLHRRFRAYREVGEWFQYEPIAAPIAELLNPIEGAA